MTDKKLLKKDTEDIKDITHDYFNKIKIEKATIGSVTEELEVQNAIYCRAVDKIKKDHGKEKLEYNHYLSMTIGGHIDNVGCLGTSHKVISVESYNPQLVDDLQKALGANLGAPSKLSKNIVGKCAEVRVADNLLKFKAKISNFKEIEFTSATRPRTQEKYKSSGEAGEYYRARCENCSAFFGEEI